jgi:F5/8 type C domain
MKTLSMQSNKPILVFLLAAFAVHFAAIGQSTGNSAVIYSNMALGKTATASSAADSSHTAVNAFDGKTNTRFTTDFNENQWLDVDLGKNYLLSSLIINWEKSYATDFDLVFSLNGSFTDLYEGSIHVRNNVFALSTAFNTDSIALKANTIARYVRLKGFHSASGNGYSIWEMQVMGSTSNANLFPVSVTAFAATLSSSSNTLDWTTITEFGNAGFSIERSSDAANFSTIGWVAARNGGTVTTHYSFTDKQPLQGKTYYRLKQIWMDGKTAYSGIITLNANNGSSSNINTYPVPVNDHLTIEYRGVASETISIALLSPAGIPVYTSKAALQGSGQQVITISRTAGMQAGQYFLRIVSSTGKNYTEKIILQ